MNQATTTSGINAGACWVKPGVVGAPLPMLRTLSSASLRRWRLLVHPLDLLIPIKSGILVPVDGFRDVHVESMGLLDDLVVQVDHPSVLAVRPHSQLPFLPGSAPVFSLELRGLDEGRTHIRVTHKRGGFEMGSLKVVVKADRTYATRTWRVKDGRGRTASRTALRMREVLAEANKFMYQANVDFYDQHHYVEQELEVAALDFRAGGIQPAQIRRDILPALDHHAERGIVADILLVPKVGTAGTDGIRDSMVTLSRPPGSGVILVQDQIGGGEQLAGGCLAHELVHVFTLPHRRKLGFDAEGHSDDDHDLMFRTVTRRSNRLDLAEIELINP